MTSALVVTGPLEEELGFNSQRIFREECGLVAALGFENASEIAYRCLGMLEHRGERGTGIASLGYDDHIHVEKRKKPARSAFTPEELEAQLPGEYAIAHARYPTAGKEDEKMRSPSNGYSSKNLQPLRYKNKHTKDMVIIHNGGFVGASHVRDSLLEKGISFRSDSDTEVFAHLIAQSDAETLEDAIVDAAHQIETAFSIIIMTPDATYALRDKYGVRPLCAARYQEGFLVASEDYAFAQFGDAKMLDPIEPGEMLVFNHASTQFRRRKYAEDDEHFCIFERFYFANPFSRHNGVFNEDFRREAGRQLSSQNPDATTLYDVVVPVLDSGKFAAQGFSEASGIEYIEALNRNQRLPLVAQGRSFTASSDEERIRIIKEKFFLREDKIKGKRVLLVDDSIVRSNTSRVLVEWLKKEGAASVGFYSAAPPIVDICPNGIDFQDKQQLVAAHHTFEEIRDLIGADDLRYLNPDLSELIANTGGGGYCTGCFGGKYPKIPNGHRRF